MSDDNLQFTGTQISYYAVCHRKLWFFTHNIRFERENDLVLQGKLVGEESYPRRDKEIAIDNLIVLDYFDHEKLVIHEVKKSRSIQRAHLKQVKYYIYFLQIRGVNTTAVIDYPLLKKKQHITLTANDIKELKTDFVSIKNIVALPQPPERKKKRVCKKCSYFEMCQL